MNKSKTTELKGPNDYEIRSMAMKLATQHSRNCHVGTLIKLADSIYDFLKGNKPKKSDD